MILKSLFCENNLIVLTTEWLTWLRTSWRYSSYEKFILIGRLTVYKETWEVTAQFILHLQYTDNPQNICEGIITNTLQSCSTKNFLALNARSDSNTDVLRVFSVLWLEDELHGQLPLRWPYSAISL